MHSKIESFLVLASVSGLMWVGRFAVSAISGGHWIGTFGVTSIILGSLIYLSRKGRLGRYGIVLKKWLDRATGKKVTIGFIFISGTILYFFGAILFGIMLAPNYSQLQTEAVQVLQNNKVPMEKNQLIQESVKQVYNQPVEKILFGYLFVIFLPIISFPVFSTLISIIDKIFNGWIGIISQITFVQEIEIIGIIIFNRIMKAKTVKSL